MKSTVIKEIRSLDKDLREKAKGFPLFKVTFKNLRDLSDSRVVEIRDWYLDLVQQESHRLLMRLLNENTKEYWVNIQKRFYNLPEYGKLQYRLQVFVATARLSMPEEIKPQRKKND